MRTSTVFVTLLAAFALLLPRATSGQDSPEREIRHFASAFEAAVRAYDVERWVELVSEDVVMMAPGGRLVEGRDDFRELWTRSFEGQTGPNPLSVVVRDVRASGELAVVRADYGPEGAEPVGRYVWVLTRRPGDGWLLDWWIFTRRP